jgi:hypothetical protein
VDAAVAPFRMAWIASSIVMSGVVLMALTDPPAETTIEIAAAVMLSGTSIMATMSYSRVAVWDGKSPRGRRSAMLRACLNCSGCYS